MIIPDHFFGNSVDRPKKKNSQKLVLHQKGWGRSLSYVKYRLGAAKLDPFSPYNLQKVKH